ncbi:glycosyl hydrolase 115 family protein [Novipirellula artificiosorum]|uniref:glycosyl hydrolase 115 family protein n=1 Tax=Novipirellula artificiosorum TaxID=2528016 RepID=UPI0021BCE1C0|nr:glycosyl hydrolase 115 family protein [Novipirellula artificiosorum]
MAGDQVVWQLGLRGKGDTAIWNSDNSVNREQGGKLISQAIAEQWEMVKEIDQRKKPPATTTRFLEGSELMSEGSLEFPEGIMVVFSDHGETQLMQDDFYHSNRYPQYGYGAYYHLAFWSSGPHLLQGSKPAKIHDVLTEVAVNGDLSYVIFNVSNVREHVLGIQASMEMTRNLDEWKIETFWDRFAPSVLHDPYQELHDCLFDLGPGRACVGQTIGGESRGKHLRSQSFRIRVERKWLLSPRSRSGFFFCRVGAELHAVQS